MDKKFDDTNRFVLFQNDRKEKETDRDYSGSINIDGRDYWLSGWRKKDKNGKPFLSGTVKQKDGTAPKAEPASGSRPSVKEEMDDEIPF